VAVGRGKVKHLKPLLLLATLFYCGVWVLTASVTFWLIEILSSHALGDLSKNPFGGIYDVMLVLVLGPVLPLIFCAGYLHLRLLSTNPFTYDKHQLIRRSIKVGTGIGLFELLMSLFIGGSLRITWLGNILMFGLPALVSSVVCGVVLGYFSTYQKQYKSS
jgi:ABC-type uncharacterized transport system permease subunit